MKKNLPTKTICPKCSGGMEPGRLMGLKYANFLPDSERKKVFGRSFRIIAYRCEQCGYCEIYTTGALRAFDLG